MISTTFDDQRPVAKGSADLSGRVAVVVGGTSGIGLAAALAMAAAGANVVAASRSADGVEEAARGIEAVAIELAEFGVCVNAVAPGIIPTALNRDILTTGRGQELLMRTPMGRFGMPEEVAAAIVFLASEAASFVTGEMLAVDGRFLASGV